MLASTMQSTDGRSNASGSCPDLQGHAGGLKFSASPSGQAAWRQTFDGGLRCRCSWLLSFGLHGAVLAGGLACAGLRWRRPGLPVMSQMHQGRARAFVCQQSGGLVAIQLRIVVGVCLRWRRLRVWSWL